MRPFALAFCGVLVAFAARADEPKGPLADKLAKVTFERYAEAPGYSEGPTWRGGEVFFCSGALLRVDDKKAVHKYLELNPAGTVLRPDGSLLVADNRFRALLLVSPAGKVEVLADRWEGRPLRSLNDLTVDARGNVYWTDPEGSTPKAPVGSVFRLRPDGRVDRVATGLAFPNGLDVDPASKFLYVIESQSKKILRYELPADDELCGKPTEFYDLGGSGGDGCAFDADGNLWVADFHRPDTVTGRITVLSPDGKARAHLPVPAKVVSNICFGGKEHDEIFCTTGDPPGVFHAKVGVKGFTGHAGEPLKALRALDVVPIKPHKDAKVLVEFVKAVSEMDFDDAGKPDPVDGRRLARLLAEMTDPALALQALNDMPAFGRASMRHVKDVRLSDEVKRLGGTVTAEVDAPRWLREITGDAALAVFGRVTEVVLNERTDGHKAPTPKKDADRVTDAWLAKWLDGQDRVRRLELSGTAVTSAGLAHLKGLKELEVLNVCLTAVSDDGFEHLARLVRMKRMVVCSSKVTGSGFKHLAGMTQLESINLHSSPASDAGLEAIGKLTGLRRLEIVHTNVTDAGLKHVGNLTRLRQLHVASHDTTELALPFVSDLTELDQLDVYEKAASNATCAQIAKLPRLRLLMLTGGPLDDSGVRDVAKVSTLEELTLNGAGVTDASIDALAGLKRVRKLNVSGTKITAEGRAKLAKLLPKAEITP